MAKIQLPPKKENTEALVKKSVGNATEKKVQNVILKGGSTTKAAEQVAEDTVKNFNIKILQSTLDTISQLREKRPKPVGQKSPGISLNGWILEAIEEKLKRERKE